MFRITRLATKNTPLEMVAVLPAESSVSEEPLQKITARCIDAQPWAEAGVADDGELTARYDLMIYLNGQPAGEVSGYHFARTGKIYDEDREGFPGLPGVDYATRSRSARTRDF